jgi:preprotein translocase subunit SecY
MSYKDDVLWYASDARARVTSRRAMATTARAATRAATIARLDARGRRRRDAGRRATARRARRARAGGAGGADGAKAGGARAEKRDDDAIDDAVARARREMYDYDDGAIAMDAGGARDAGAALERAAPALRAPIRLIRSGIFRRACGVAAMMVFVRAGLLLPSRFYASTGGYESPFSMSTLMSTFAGSGGAALDAMANALGGDKTAAVTQGANWLADSMSAGGGVPWFHIGIGPFIGASIAMSVVVAFSPDLQRMRKDEMGRETIEWWTRLMTLAIAVIQSVIEARTLKVYSLVGTGLGYYLAVVPMFITGALAITWVADEITDYGLGQGSSVIITMSICGGYFAALKALLPKIMTDFSFATALPAFAFFGVLMLGTVLLEQGTAKVPLQYFQGPSGSAGLPKAFKEDEGDHIPFKINPTNMQPVIFSMFLLSALQWLPFGFLSWINGQSVGYFVLLFILVFAGTYVDLQNTPQDISEYIMKIGARVPGIRPGTKTVEFFSRVQAGARFFGGILLATIATICSLTDLWMSKTTGQSIGLTSMLIVVSTVIAVKRQIQAMSQMPKMDEVLQTM